MNTDRQQKLADTLYYGVGQVMQAQRNAVAWFQGIPTVQKVIVVGVVVAVVLAVIFGFYTRYRLGVLMQFDTAPSFLTDISKLHNTHRPYQYQYANGTTVPYLPSNLFPTYNNFQFTWTFWIFVNGFDPQGKGNDWGKYRFGEWKHVLSHGSSDILADPNVTLETQQYPGFWLKPKENTLTCVLNTRAAAPKQQVNIDLVDIPMNEWFNVTLVLEEMSLSLYRNGELVTTTMLLDPPSFVANQNVYITNGGGYPGELYNVTYFNEALEPNRIRLLYKEGKAEIDAHVYSQNYTKFVKREFKVQNLSKQPDINVSQTASSSGAAKHTNIFKEAKDKWF